jgi:hypothetical protein
MAILFYRRKQSNKIRLAKLSNANGESCRMCTVAALLTYLANMMIEKPGYSIIVLNLKSVFIRWLSRSVNIYKTNKTTK